MGFSYCDAMMLWNARLRGVSFDDLVTVGHQTLYLHRRDLKSLRMAYQSSMQSAHTPLDDYSWGDYSDAFLREYLGASSITIVDASSYEGATRIHDLNTPIPDDLRGRFDAAIESGSLEHIFNVPVAIANLAAMVRVGGTVFITTPANNLMGHGFYQFSPELMFRVFTDENGFALHKVLLFEAVYPSVELTPNRDVYEVVDPERVRSRVGLLSSKPVMMMVEARKQRDVPLFASVPLQSDYVTRWESANRPRTNSPLRQVLKSAFRALPLVLQTRILGYQERRAFSLANTRFYRKVRRQG